MHIARKANLKEGAECLRNMETKVNRNFIVEMKRSKT